jgi:hypothetical protein
VYTPVWCVCVCVCVGVCVCVCVCVRVCVRAVFLQKEGKTQVNFMAELRFRV